MLNKKSMMLALVTAAAVSSSAYAGEREFNTLAGAVSVPPSAIAAADAMAPSSVA
jgi:hypothetical protein